MTSAQAILVGASLIAASILFVNTLHTANAQHVGPFELMHHSNTTANVGVFRLDVSSGDVSYCYIADPSSASVACTRAVR
jgi:hypothetical protein